MFVFKLFVILTNITKKIKRYDTTLIQKTPTIYLVGFFYAVL